MPSANCWTELLLDLIEAIEDPSIKAQKLTLFHQALVKETSKPPIKIQQPKVDLEQIYSRFTQPKKEVTVNDLQKQIKEARSEFRSLKQELTIQRTRSKTKLSSSQETLAHLLFDIQQSWL